jgi:hypothetical protein
MSQTKVITGKVRFSYVHVFEPQAAEGSDKEKYSVSIIIPKEDKKTLDKIDKAIELALENGKAKFGGKIPKGLKMPLRDGDEERDDEAYAGSMFLSANSMIKPGIVDENLDPIMDKDEFYSGCYGRASINFYAFNVGGNKGIACGLNNLQKLEDGERLGGSISSAQDDFGSTDDDLL